MNCTKARTTRSQSPTVPYDLIAALPGCDRKSEAFTFGYLDSITFYYGKIGAFCWCVAALPPAAGTGAANVCTSMDNGETWSISIPDALYTGTVIGAGFASEMVGFISYRYFFDNGPEIARTLERRQNMGAAGTGYSGRIRAVQYAAAESNVFRQ